MRILPVSMRLAIHDPAKLMDEDVDDVIGAVGRIIC